MGSYSDYLENEALNRVWGSGSPASIFIALMLVMPAEDGTGGTEVTGTAYARLEIVNNTTNFPNASSSTVSLAIQHQFPDAGSNWGSVVGAAAYDASSGGNLLAIDDFTPINVVTGTRVVIGPGGIVAIQD